MMPDWRNISLKIRWEGVTAPYRGKPVQSIITEVQNAVDVGNRQIDAARVLRSGDILLLTRKAEDTEFLVETCDQWLPRLPHGARARIIPEMFSILVHAVPKSIFSKKCISSGEARAIILQENSHRVPRHVFSTQHGPEVVKPSARVNQKVLSSSASTVPKTPTHFFENP
jgi:hypothetical protein